MFMDTSGYWVGLVKKFTQFPGLELTAERFSSSTSWMLFLFPSSLISFSPVQLQQL